MIIWGWRSLKRTLSVGKFFCPEEDTDRNYRQVEVRRWFTFFFIPLIPLAIQGNYIECDGCGNAYYPSVLDTSTSEEMDPMLLNAARP